MENFDVEQQKANSNHGDGKAGGTRLTAHGQQQAFTAFDQPRALTVNLMEQVCDPTNLVHAYRRVRANKGTPGVDGMTVGGLADWLRQHNEALNHPNFGLPNGSIASSTFGQITGASDPRMLQASMKLVF